MRERVSVCASVCAGGGGGNWAGWKCMHLMSAVAMATRVFLHAAVAVFNPAAGFRGAAWRRAGAGGVTMTTPGPLCPPARAGRPKAASPSLLRPFPRQRLAGTEPPVPATLRSPELALVTSRQMLSSGVPAPPILTLHGGCEVAEPQFSTFFFPLG